MASPKRNTGVADVFSVRSWRASAGEADITEIAFVLGFDEVNSFSRVFQRHVGTTPLRWRATIAKGAPTTA